MEDLRWPEPEPTKKEKRIGRTMYEVFIGGTLIFVIGFWIYTAINENFIKSDYDKTEGWIVYYNEGAADGSITRNIRYAYTVNGITYTRKRQSNVAFNECYGELRDACKAKRFWVIFSRQDNSMSLIDFHREIQNDSIPKFPASLDGFR